MPNYVPPFGLDPNIVIRNPDKYPKLLLRGIYDVMKREEKEGHGSLMERYRKGFNVVVSGMVKAKPPRLRVTADRDLELASFGVRREVEVTRGAEQQVTQKRLKEFYRWLEVLRTELPDNQPSGDPTTRGGSRAE